MAHEIMFTLPTQPLGKVDAQFTINKDGQILGTLKISKGTIDWTPKDFAHDNPFQLSWTKFDKLMCEQKRKKE
jgi:hypothetical protein